MPHRYHQIGDLAVLAGHYNTTAQTITGITGTQSGPWTLQFRQTDATLDKTTDIWTAPVTATAAADLLTITYSGSLTGITTDYWPDSLSAGLGSSTVWSFPAADSTRHDTSITTIAYPRLTSGAANAQAYLGVVADTATATGGSTPGFTYIDSPNSGNEMVYDLGLAPNTVYAPTSNPIGGWVSHGWDHHRGPIGRRPSPSLLRLPTPSTAPRYWRQRPARVSR